MTFADLVEVSMRSYRYKVIEVPKDEFYCHTTIEISELSEYIQFICDISRLFGKTLHDDKVIYRGMESYKYNLIPGLARLKKLNDYTEEELVKDFYNRRPNDFTGLSDFDTLAKMQHYGLPTRLLDFTTNPLVALFFACCSKPSIDGRVVCHSTMLDNEWSDVEATIFSKITNGQFDNCVPIEQYCCNEKYSLKAYINEFYLDPFNYAIRPKYWNDRIRNQEGVFLAFNNGIRDRFWNVFMFVEELGFDKALDSYGNEYMRNNRDIVQEAYSIEPIDFYREQKTSFETEETMIARYNSYVESGNEKLFWERIKNRFMLSPSLKPISKRQIERDYCSIIIKAKNKKNIINELASVGISEAFIYPELEYTAKEIKRRFT